MLSLHPNVHTNFWGSPSHLQIRRPYQINQSGSHLFSASIFRIKAAELLLPTRMGTILCLLYLRHFLVCMCSFYWGGGLLGPRCNAWLSDGDGCTYCDVLCTCSDIYITVSVNIRGICTHVHTQTHEWLWAVNRTVGQNVCHCAGTKNSDIYRLSFQKLELTFWTDCVYSPFNTISDLKSGNLNFLELSGPLQACNGTDLPL